MSADHACKEAQHASRRCLQQNKNMFRAVGAGRHSKIGRCFQNRAVRGGAAAALGLTEGTLAGRCLGSTPAAYPNLPGFAELVTILVLFR